MKNKINVYLAGKIQSNGWRQQIIDIRNKVMYWGDYNVSKIKNLKLSYNNDIDIVGPFFLSCDHSCYHGEGNHGLGINCPNGCYGEKTFTEKEVYDICLSQIRNSDIVFAYINDYTCYGTLYELGYAKSLGKKIIILFESGKLMKDMWFIYQKADIVELVDKSERDYSIKRYFDELINKI